MTTKYIYTAEYLQVEVELSTQRLEGWRMNLHSCSCHLLAPTRLDWAFTTIRPTYLALKCIILYYQCTIFQQWSQSPSKYCIIQNCAKFSTSWTTTMTARSRRRKCWRCWSEVVGGWHRSSWMTSSTSLTGMVKCMHDITIFLLKLISLLFLLFSIEIWPQLQKIFRWWRSELARVCACGQETGWKTQGTIGAYISG